MPLRDVRVVGRWGDWQNLAEQTSSAYLFGASGKPGAVQSKLYYAIDNVDARYRSNSEGASRCPSNYSNGTIRLDRLAAPLRLIKCNGPFGATFGPESRN